MTSADVWACREEVARAGGSAHFAWSPSFGYCYGCDDWQHDQRVPDDAYVVLVTSAPPFWPSERGGAAAALSGAGGVRTTRERVPPRAPLAAVLLPCALAALAAALALAQLALARSGHSWRRRLAERAHNSVRSTTTCALGVAPARASFAAGREGGPARGRQML